MYYNDYNEIRRFLNYSISNLVDKKSSKGSDDYYKSRNCKRIFVFDEENYLFANNMLFALLNSEDFDEFELFIESKGYIFENDYSGLCKFLDNNKTSFIRRIDNTDTDRNKKRNIFIFRFGDDEYKIKAHRFAMYITEKDHASHEDLRITISIKAYEEDMPCYLVNPILDYGYCAGIFRERYGKDTIEKIIELIDNELKKGNTFEEAKKNIINEFHLDELDKEMKQDFNNFFKIISDYIYW